MLTILVVIGTRPEAIKLAPVIKELAQHTDSIRTQVCVTGQHRETAHRSIAAAPVQLPRQPRPPWQ